MLLICSIRAMRRLQLAYAPRRSILKSWLATSQSFRKRWRPLRPPASAWKMSAQTYVTMPAELKDRLVAIDRLKRKYGPSLVDVIHHGEEVSRKLSEMENKDEILGQLRKELAEAGEEYLRAARIISKKRYEAARKLEKLVASEINDLAMRADFQIEVSGTDEEGNWTASGFDQVLYLISTNPGEPLR